MEAPVRIGIVFPHQAVGVNPVAIRDWAQAAEDLGFDHIIILEHVIGPDLFFLQAAQPPVTGLPSRSRGCLDIDRRDAAVHQLVGGGAGIRVFNDTADQFTAVITPSIRKIRHLRPAPLVLEL